MNFADISDPIPKIHFSSENFPAPGEAYDAFWEGCFRSFYDAVDCDSMRREEFRAEVECWNLGDALFGRTAIEGFQFGRSQRKLHQDNVDHFMIQYFIDMDGSYVSDAAGRQSAIRPGSVHVLDFARPFKGESDSANTITMLVSRSLMAAAMPIDVLHGSLLEGSRAAIIGDHFQALLRRLPSVPAADATAIARGTVDLLAALLTPASGAPPRANGALTEALLDRARRHIHQHLDSEACTPDAICGALRVSRTTLYRAFEPLDGVAAYIQRCRLEKIRRALVDPRERRRIGELAYESGFADAASFNRLFKQAYGLAPRAYREQELHRHHRIGADSGIDGIGCFDSWIRRLASP